MRLCSASTFFSAASMKARIAEDGTPCASGALRGRAEGSATAAVAANSSRAIDLMAADCLTPARKGSGLELRRFSLAPFGPGLSGTRPTIRPMARPLRIEYPGALSIT